MGLTGKIAAVVSAAIPVRYRPNFNAGISEKTGSVFSVIKLATSGSLIFPNKISHSKKRRLKRKDYELWHQNKKVRQREKKHCLTYNCQKIRTRKSSPLMFKFVKSLLVAPWSLTLVGLIFGG